jgi:DNA-directed RNA polymerase specialized sigma24 family protein
MMDSVPATKEVFGTIDNSVERGFFVLHYLWGLTFEEIAEAFDTKPEVAKYLTQKAKEKVVSEYGFR